MMYRWIGFCWRFCNFFFFFLHLHARRNFLGIIVVYVYIHALLRHRRGALMDVL
jgi:hypothetical protein